MASPFIFAMTKNIAMWNHIITGNLIVLLAGANFLKASEDKPGGVMATRVALLGLWVLASPFLYGFPDYMGFWNNIIVGTLIVFTASNAAYEAKLRDQARTETSCQIGDG